MSHDCKYEGQWERVLDKIEKIDDTLKDTNSTLLRNTISLESHMARTKQVEDMLIPIHRVYIWGLLCVKGLAVLGVLVSIIIGLSKL